MIMDSPAAAAVDYEKYWNDEKNWYVYTVLSLSPKEKEKMTLKLLCSFDVSGTMASIFARMILASGCPKRNAGWVCQ